MGKVLPVKLSNWHHITLNHKKNKHMTPYYFKKNSIGNLIEPCPIDHKRKSDSITFTPLIGSCYCKHFCIYNKTMEDVDGESTFWADFILCEKQLEIDTQIDKQIKINF